MNINMSLPLLDKISRPLVTFALIAYKQEKFIREAVSSALAQTYTPLEIILSDDYSPDNTFAIMQEVAATYYGPHNIILNRNEKNIGLGAHINKIMTLSKGELIIAAAGDDVSCPDRTSEIVNEWLRLGKRPSSIHSDREVINEEGVVQTCDRNTQGYEGSRTGIMDVLAFLRDQHPACRINGATHAWSRSTFVMAGPINEDVVFEDKAIIFRSLIAGYIAYVPRKLVQYRRHSDNLWGARIDALSRSVRYRKHIELEWRNAQRWPSVLRNYMKDVDAFAKQGFVSCKEVKIIYREIRRCLLRRRCELGVYSGNPILSWGWFILGLFCWPRMSLNSLKVMTKQLCFRTADCFGFVNWFD